LVEDVLAVKGMENTTSGSPLSAVRIRFRSLLIKRSSFQPLSPSLFLMLGTILTYVILRLASSLNIDFFFQQLSHSLSALPEILEFSTSSHQTLLSSPSTFSHRFIKCHCLCCTKLLSYPMVLIISQPFLWTRHRIEPVCFIFPFFVKQLCTFEGAGEKLNDSNDL
jgi:hypothetical protein